MSRHYYQHKPFSVSYGAWPALAALGEQRKTRVFSNEAYMDAHEPDSISASYGVQIFNRISDKHRNGVFVMANDPDHTQYLRVNAPTGWFDVAQPDHMHFSSDGMVPAGKELVFLTSPQTNAAFAVAEKSMSDVAEGKGSSFAAETVIIQKAHKLAVAGAAGVQVFKDLARVAHYMGMPRAKAFAEQELVLGQQLGFGRRNRTGIIPQRIA